MDEILEGYRTFTALAAEVSTPGGSGILSRYGTGDKLQADHVEDAVPSTRLGTLGDYAPLQQQQQRQAAMVGHIGGDGGAKRRRGGAGVPYFDPASDPVVVDALRLLFAKEGNYVQDLVSISQGHAHVCAALRTTELREEASLLEVRVFAKISICTFQGDVTGDGSPLDIL